MDRMLHTVAEASHLLCIQKTKIYELMGNGELPSVTIGRARRIPRDGIEEFIRRRSESQSESARSRVSAT